jgi:hypothetical protein
MAGKEENIFRREIAAVNERFVAAEREGEGVARAG